MVDPDLDSTDWKMFRTYATEFYKQTVMVCIDAAGHDNPEIFSRLLEKALPSVLELYAVWQKDKDKEAKAS